MTINFRPFSQLTLHAPHDSNGPLWLSMSPVAPHSYPWLPVALIAPHGSHGSHGSPWLPRVPHAFPGLPMALHVAPNGSPQLPVAPNGSPWLPLALMAPHGCLWLSKWLLTGLLGSLWPSLWLHPIACLMAPEALKCWTRGQVEPTK